MSRNIYIVDYGMGNLMSVYRALEMLGCQPVISNQAEDIEKADKVILPGVGAFSSAMDNLNSLGLVEILTEKVLIKKAPFLGICLGMQLIAEDSYEFGYHKGLGWIPASVRKLEVPEGMRLPHMGWNEVKPVECASSIFNGITGEMSYYFVHSYHVHCYDENYIGSICEYGQEFVSSIQYENIFATQFHPEKSQKNGIQLLKNFINY